MKMGSGIYYTWRYRRAYAYSSYRCQVWCVAGSQYIRVRILRGCYQVNGVWTELTFALSFAMLVLNNVQRQAPVVIVYDKLIVCTGVTAGHHSATLPHRDGSVESSYWSAQLIDLGYATEFCLHSVCGTFYAICRAHMYHTED